MPARFFTDAAVTAAARIHPTLTTVERRALIEILGFTSRPDNMDMELLQCLDAAGTQVHATSTGYKAAPVTDEMKAAMSAGAVRQWHNHPSQDSLSNFDWECAGAFANTEVLALNRRGTIFVGRIADWDDRLHQLLPWLPRLAGDLELYMDALARERELDSNDRVELSTKTGHVLNVALARCTSVSYAYCLMAADERVISACEALGIISDGVSYAEAAIRKFLDGMPAPDPRSTEQSAKGVQSAAGSLAG